MANNDTVLIPAPGIPNLTYDEAAIVLNSQKLWIDLVHWLRAFFHSYLRDEPDLAAVANQLFQQMPLKFYEEFSRHFSPADSVKLYDIISRLILINWQLIDAYKKNSQDLIDESTVQWYRTADELADFLASVNPYWDATTLRTMLYRYMQLKIQEIIAFLREDYELETKIFNEIENKAIGLSNYLAMGIISKRPRQGPPSGTMRYCQSTSGN